MPYVNQTKFPKRYLTLKRENHMKTLFASATLVIGLMASAGAFAKANEMAAPAGTPAGTTGVCNDGSLNTTPTKTGACQGHKGIKAWYTASAAAATPAPTTATPPTTTPAAAPAKKGLMSIFSKKTTAPAAAGTTATAATATPAATAKTTTSATTPAAGGGAGQVWVNTASKVYHCSGSKYYGKTKAGQYMTEAAAKAAGDRPDHGKACS